MKRFLLLSIAALLFAAAYLGTDLKSVPTSAFATGGGYTATKHGGGTTDGVTPCGGGVNRAKQGTDYLPGGCASANTYYNPAEAGTYASGECAHCHEPHASFGTTTSTLNEPPPNTVGTDQGPDPYLLMKEYGTVTNYSNLCWYCHENLQVGAPLQPLGYGYWGFYQGGPATNATGGYQTSSHYLNQDGGSTMIWPGGTGGAPGVGAATDTVATWPRRQRSTACATNQGDCGSCLNCHTPHGVSGTFDSGTPATTNYLVGAASGLIPRQLIAREEALCLNCHDSTGPAATDIKTLVDSYLYITGDSATQGSGHPIRNKNRLDRHRLAGNGAAQNEANRLAGWFTSGSLHAECTDCHNPHTVRGRGTMTTDVLVSPWYGNVYQFSQNPGKNPAPSVFNPLRYDGANSSTSPVRIGYPNIGVWGVTVSSAATGAITAAAVANLNRTTPNRLYDLCFKCHSQWAWDSANGNTFGNSALTAPSTTKSWTSSGGTAGAMPSSYPMTNVSAEFATNNVAYHPVFDVGKNRPETLAVPKRNPNWCVNNGAPTTSSYTTTDTCNAAIGARQDLINVTESVKAVSIQLEQTLSQTFVPPWRHTSIITCVDCHEDEAAGDTTPRGPHGSARPFILRKIDTTISYTICLTTGVAACGSTTVINYAGFTNAEADIFCLNCHRGDVYHGGCTNCGGAGTPNRRNFSRQPHPPRAATNNEGINNANYTNPPRGGIACMGCHGGGGYISSVPATAQSGNACTTGTCKLGNIHGHPNTTDNRASGGVGSRLITHGANWELWASGVADPLTSGSCGTTFTANPWSGCGNTTRSATGISSGTTYNYP